MQYNTTLTPNQREKYQISYDLERQIKQEMLHLAKNTPGINSISMVIKVVTKHEYLSSEFKSSGILRQWAKEILFRSPVLDLELNLEEKRLLQYALNFLKANFEEEKEYVSANYDQLQALSQKLFPYIH